MWVFITTYRNSKKTAVNYFENSFRLKSMVLV